jgi:hypothetical protein
MNTAPFWNRVAWWWKDQSSDPREPGVLGRRIGAGAEKAEPAKHGRSVARRLQFDILERPGYDEAKLGRFGPGGDEGPKRFTRLEASRRTVQVGTGGRIPVRSPA